MSFWTNAVSRIFAWAVVAIQTVFGVLEIFTPRLVFSEVFGTAYDSTDTSPVWIETAKLARNMGLYNWFLAFGLLLSLTGRLGGAPTSQFFLLCVAVAGLFALVSVSCDVSFIAQLGLGLIACFLLKCDDRNRPAMG